MSVRVLTKQYMSFYRAKVFQKDITVRKIVAAFRGMYVSPAKHSFGKFDRKVTDRRTDGQTDGQTTYKVIPMCRYASQSLCFAGDTKIGQQEL